MKNPEFWSILFYIFGVLGICILMLGLAFITGGRSKARHKNIHFESGAPSVGDTKIHFSAQFYLIAMFFVIFDVEALYLYVWAVSIKEVGWSGFIEASIFIFVLLVGLFYLARIGALDWTPKRSKRKKI